LKRKQSKVSIFQACFFFKKNKITWSET